MNKYFFIFPLIRNRKCKTKLRQSKQTILDDDVFNNEDLDDILFRHQDDEVLDEEDRPLKPPKKAKRKPRSKPAPGYGPAPDRKVYNCKYCEFNGKKLEWLAHLKSAHSDKNLVCRIANHGPKQVECCWNHLSNKTLELCCFETDNQNDSGLLTESSFQ